MFGIKRKGREQSAKIHRLVSDSLRPVFEKISQKIRYPARRMLLNRWGRHNPKRVVALYGMFAVTVLAVNSVCLFSYDPAASKGGDMLKMTDKTAVNPVGGMFRINVNRQAIGASVYEYAGAGIELASRLDSLRRLDIKTRQDSIDIVTIYNKLNKNNSNDEP